MKYCTHEHAAQAKKERDNARPAPSKDERDRWNATYRSKHRNLINAREREWKAMHRALHGRGDRSAEYIKRHGRAPVKRADIASKATAEKLATLIGIIARRAQIAYARQIKPKRDEAAEWRERYRNDQAFRQAEIQRLKRSKLKRKAAMQSSLTKAQTIAVYAERSTCLYCGCSLDEGSKTLDHMDPLSRGGLHEAFNLVVSCAKCNTRKSAKAFDCWVETLPVARRPMVRAFYQSRMNRLCCSASGPSDTPAS